MVLYLDKLSGSWKVREQVTQMVILRVIASVQLLALLWEFEKGFQLDIQSLD